jgi:N-acetylmuramoyl-L-alanine amidase
VLDSSLSRRSCALISGIVALAILPVNAGHAFHWPWQKDKPEKGPATRAASQKPAAAEKIRPAKLTPDEKPVAFKCDPTTFRIIVDVGHTAESDGAMSARNVPEFQFNLNLAKRIVEGLKSDGFPEAKLLVTTGKARPSLAKRVAAADALKGNFLLSIHHDSVPDKFMEKWDYEGKPSYFSDRFSGYSVFVSHSNMDFKTSFAFAQLLGRQMKGQGLQYATQYTQAFMGRYQRELLDKDVGVYAYDRLIVLMHSQMPAVLLEAGSISNRDEELKMASPERQDMTVKAVTTAMKQFCGVAQPHLEAKTQPDANNQAQSSLEAKTRPQPPPEPKTEPAQPSQPEARSQPEASGQTPSK